MAPADDDLPALANALAELVGAPITIEDPSSRVLAYSESREAARSQAVDDARITTILGRQVPPDYRRLLDEAGVFDRIASSDEVLYVALPGSVMTPRAIVAVRDETGSLVGSIWAAVDGGVDEAQRRALRDGAEVVARHLALARDRADAVRRRSAETVETLLRGGGEAVRAAAAAGLRGPLTVVRLVPGPGDATLPAHRAGAFVLHLAAVAPSAAAARVDDAVLAVVAGDERDAVRLTRDFLARGRGNLVAGVGRTAAGPAALDVSGRDAEEAALALRRRGASGVVASVRDVLADVVALRTVEAVADLEELSPLVTLEDFDAAHRTELVAAVRAYLEADGDVAAAARATHVHANTLRNRLRRASQSAGVDVEDPPTRLLLTLHLRQRDLRP